MEEDMTSSHKMIGIFEKHLAIPGISEKFKSDTKQHIIQYCKDFEGFEQSRNLYQRRLMKEQSN